MRCSYCNVDLNKSALRTHSIVCPCEEKTYCDKLCQRSDWNEGSHREDCRALTRSHKNQPFSPPPPASSTAAARSRPPTAPPPAAARSRPATAPPPAAARSRPDSSPPPPITENPPRKKDKEGRFRRPDSSPPPPTTEKPPRKKDKEGKFLPNPNTERSTAQSKANSVDFKRARESLQSIIDRQAEHNQEWGFKIDCQKAAKYARKKAHNWQSSNYEKFLGGTEEETLDAPSSDEETPEQVVQRAQRACIFCKNTIKGAQWSYIVCRGAGCKNKMAHFDCLGFPNITPALAKLMKKEYWCQACHRKHQEEMDDDSDLDNFEEPKKRKKKTNAPKKSKKAKEDDDDSAAAFTD